MREMRLAKREITDPEVLKEIVEECDTVRLGLTDAEGMFIVPVNYGYEFTEENGKAELQLYFHGAAEGRKADALKSQSPVAVEMDCRHGIITGDYTCAYSYSYRSIMGNGTVTLLETFEEKEKGLQRIMEHMAPGAKIEFRPVSDWYESHGNFPVCRSYLPYVPVLCRTSLRQELPLLPQADR